MEKYVKIINIIDRSGSMQSMKATSIESFNGFIESQKQIEGKAIVTTVLFSNLYNKLYENIDLFQCPSLNEQNYVCNGSTALYDSVMYTLHNEIDYIATLPKEERPEKTLCIILTDGYNNASHKYTNEDVKRMIGEMREDFNWEFIFLAANEEASTTA